MKISIVVLIFSFSLWSFMSFEQDPYTQQLIDEIDALTTQDDFTDEPDFWKAQLNNERYASNQIARSKILYKIGRSFAPISLDSAEFYCVKSLGLVENKGYEMLETSIYNGLGNIANARSQPYQAAFYYNKVVAILDAGNAHKIPIEHQVRFNLHAAQANLFVSLYPRALQQNRNAKALLSQLPEGFEDIKFRTYDQLFNVHAEYTGDVDSMAYYLKKCEGFADDDYKIRYLNENKAKFYYKIQDYPQSIAYNRLCLAYDMAALKDESVPLSKQTLHNVLISYKNLIMSAVDYKNKSLATQYVQEVNELMGQYDVKDRYDDVSIGLTQSLRDYYGLMNDFDNYKIQSEKLYRLMNQMHQSNQMQAIEEMNAVYQLKAKDKSIKTLSTAVYQKSNELKNTRFWLIILGLLTVLSILLSRMYMVRKKNEQLKQTHENAFLQQKLLRTQIEPHFIFNTLSSLQSMIRFDEKDKSIKYLNQFSRLLRNSLELSRHDWVALQDELDTLESYLSLQAMRFKFHFSYEIKVDAAIDTDEILIPPMFIQPFVENSIKHGFQGNEKQWQLTIEVQKASDTLLQIIIKDNGVGIESRKVNQKTHRSLSGAIAKERLQLLTKKHKQKASYEVTSSEEGTCIILYLPIQLN